MKFTHCDHDQVEAMFAGLQLGHPPYKINGTMAHIEEDYKLVPRSASQQRVRNELARLGRRASPEVSRALIEAGVRN